MTTHRSTVRKARIPNWLKAWYASLVFMSLVIFLSLMFK